MTTGSYNLNDLLAVRNASAAEFGLDTINKVLQADLAYYNSEVANQLAWFADPLTEQQRIYGTSAIVAMTESDEFGAPPTQKNLPGATVGFPLRLFRSSIGWTSKYLEIATPAELASKYLEVRRGHAAQMILQVKKAIYNNTNYTYVDNLTNGVSLGIKRFANADGAAIPNSPAGVSFDGSTHQHYVGTAGASLAAVDITTLIANVTEHGLTKGVKVVINLSNKAAVAAFTSNFTPLTSSLIIPAATGDSTVVKLNNDDLENQLVGYWDNWVEVWVKPWAQADHILCFASEAIEKALGFRQRPQSALQGLRIAASINDFPLIAETAEAEFGFGVWNRVCGACLDAGNQTTWTNPTITA